MSTHEHVWDRFMTGWHVAFGLFVGLAAIWVTSTTHLTPAERVACFALLGVLAVAYATLVLPASQDVRQGHRGTAYLLVAVAVTGVACAVDVAMTMLLFVVFSHVWMFTATRFRGAVFAALLTVSASAGLMTNAGWSAEVAREVVPQLGIALGFSLLLGFWVARIIDQSKERADLITQIEAARADLALAEQARGTLAERERVAREIHDTLAQGFTSIVMLAQGAAARLPHDPDGAADRLGTIEEVARDNLAEARALVAALSPVDLDGRTFADAVRRLGERFARETGLVVRVEAPEAVAHLTRDGEVVLLRAVQEALTNVRRHSGARSVVLRLVPQDGDVRLEVTDDGQGFTPGAAEGFGLTGMRGRVGEVGGDVDVASAPGGGTHLVVRVPLVAAGGGA
ncbi:sensor histidine kinase [Kineosporia sp. R_H_3]|uniref:sensor histidine kinase n=1 Tax=Kineosporia sp. R_H_3 TaxID=1961848 RepID=UPI0013040CF1|nr:sensor histidine kinase [Kineosporia sp. R_H_3]